MIYGKKDSTFVMSAMYFCFIASHSMIGNFPKKKRASPIHRPLKVRVLRLVIICPSLPLLVLFVLSVCLRILLIVHLLAISPAISHFSPERKKRFSFTFLSLINKNTAKPVYTGHLQFRKKCLLHTGVRQVEVFL